VFSPTFGFEKNHRFFKYPHGRTRPFWAGDSRERADPSVPLSQSRVAESPMARRRAENPPRWPVLIPPIFLVQALETILGPSRPGSSSLGKNALRKCRPRGRQ